MKIFISYRRADSIYISGRIYDQLSAKFGTDAIFKDVDSIPLGTDFREYIDEAIIRCKVFLAVIGDQWLSVKEKDGTRRLDNPEDFVRIEIESALSRGIPVIPVLVRGAGMPSESVLPSSLKGLAYRNGIELRADPDFHRDMDRLITSIERLITKPAAPPPDSAPPSLQAFEFDVVRVDAKGREVNREKGQAQYFTEDLGNGVALEIVYIPGDTFTMGSSAQEKGSSDNELPQHEVTVQPFFMGKFQVTQAQWRAIATLSKVNRDLNPDPSKFKGDNRPVEQVSWYDAVEFCARLSNLTGREYRLPSEAEWEYACRARTTTPFHFGKTITGELANYSASATYANEPKGEALRETSPVGSFPSNAFGLYEMHGNVWEWCADTWHDDYSRAPTYGSAWLDDNNNDHQLALLRGGSWCSPPDNCRSAYRYHLVRARRSNISYNVGFRVVCGVDWTFSFTEPNEVELLSEKGVDYTKLRDLLAAGQWKKADSETYRVMLSVVHREKEAWLRDKDINEFPCTDLRTIDQLWGKYSNGRFGFSVQKRIYQSLGGTREFNEQICEAFCDRVGWRVNNYWLYYNNLTFNLSARPGHLPYVFERRGTLSIWDLKRSEQSRRLVRGISSLVQRLVDCSI